MLNLESQEETKCFVCKSEVSDSILLHPNNVFHCQCRYSFCQNCFEKHDPIECFKCRKPNILPYGNEILTVKEKVLYVLLALSLTGLSIFWLYVIIVVNEFKNMVVYMLMYYIFVNSYILAVLTFLFHPTVSLRFVRNKMRKGFKLGTSMMVLFYFFLALAPERFFLYDIASGTALIVYTTYYLGRKWRKCGDN